MLANKITPQSRQCSTAFTGSPRAMTRSTPPAACPLCFVLPPVHGASATNASFSLLRSKYRFGRTLGAGTYGIVREAEGPNGRVAIKIILKKVVRGNERMVLDELDMLQRLKHPHIVKFVDWFESRVCTHLFGARGKKVPKRMGADHVLALGQILYRHRARSRWGTV